MNNDVEEVFSRGVVEFIDPNGSFKEKLIKKVKGEYTQDIVIKHGIDPTRPDIHIGHAVVLRKLRQFQDLGCKVIFLVGNFTAQIGDPTGKSKVRPEVSAEEIETNMRTFVDQVGKILRTDDKVFSWVTNADWFLGVTDIMAGPGTKVELEGKPVDPNSFVGKAVLYENTRLQKTHLKNTSIQSVSLARILSVMRNITHSRLIARDMFQERIKKGEELYMHEVMYPILQGVDSAVLAQIYGSCDMEIGGTDQTFNMIIGRDVMKMSQLPEQAVMTMELLQGTDGNEKMSKSLDNYIAITESPQEMFGKTMSISDECITTYFRLATYTPTSEIEEIDKKLKADKVNPRDIKLRLAREIVSIYHGDSAAKSAEENFIETFSNKGVPNDIETIKVSRGSKIVEILISQGMVKSKTEWRRLVSEGAVKNIETGEGLTDAESVLEEPVSLKIGKHRFIRIESL